MAASKPEVRSPAPNAAGDSDDEWRSEEPTGWHVRLVHGSMTWRAIQLVPIVTVFAALLVAGLVLPVIEARLVSRFVALGVALLGLQIVIGPARQLSLCHGTFVGVGSYTTTIAISRYGLPHLAGVALAPVFAMVVGCVVGLLALRIRATYLGPVTLSVAVVFPMIIKRFGWFTGGGGGLPRVADMGSPSVLNIDPSDAYKWTHIVIVAIAIGAMVVARNLMGSQVGLAVRATAENALSATTSGINVRRTRILSYGWGAAFGGLGGGLLVLDTPVIGADYYDLFRSLGFYAAVMVGGAASMIGAAIGSALIIGVPWVLEQRSSSLSPNLVLGALLVGSILVAPGGLVVGIRSLLMRFIHIVRIHRPADD